MIANCLCSTPSLMQNLSALSCSCGSMKKAVVQHVLMSECGFSPLCFTVLWRLGFSDKPKGEGALQKSQPQCTGSVEVWRTDEGSCCPLCDGSKSQRTLLYFSHRNSQHCKWQDHLSLCLTGMSPGNWRFSSHWPRCSLVSIPHHCSCSLQSMQSLSLSALTAWISSAYSVNASVSDRLWQDRLHSHIRPLSTASLRGSGMFLIYKHLSKENIGLFRALLTLLSPGSFRSAAQFYFCFLVIFIFFLYGVMKKRM